MEGTVEEILQLPHPYQTGRGEKNNFAVSTDCLMYAGWLKTKATFSVCYLSSTPGCIPAVSLNMKL